MFHRTRFYEKHRRNPTKYGRIMVNPEAEAYKEKGNAAMGKGDMETAVSMYSEAISLDCSNHVYFSNRSAAFASMGKYQDALLDAEHTVRLNPTWGKGYSRLGAALHLLGRTQEALEAYKNGLSHEPNNEQLKKALQDLESQPQSQFGGNDMGFMGEQFMSRLRSDPRTAAYMRDPSFLSSLANVSKNPAMAMNDPRIMTAMEVIMSGMTPPNGAPQPPPPRDDHSYAQPSQSSHTQKTEEKNQEKFKDTKEQEAESENQKGTEAYKQSNFETALKHFEKAIEISPNVIKFHSNVAAVYYEQGKYDECIQKCDEAYSIGREYGASYKEMSKPFVRMGKAYLKLGNRSEALKSFQKSFIEYRDPEIVKLANKISKKMKEEEELAYIDLDLAEKEKALGNKFFGELNYRQALEHYTEANKRNPKDPKILANRAAALTKLGHHSSSIDDCDRAIKLDPNFIKPYLRKAFNIYSLENPVQARSVYKKVLSMDPRCQEAIDGIAKCQEVISKLPEDELKRLVMNDPEIQPILQDPTMQLVLQQMQSNPQAVTEFMKDPKVAANIQKLIEVGVIKLG